MSYTDWIELVDATIPNKQELSVLEFGLGEGTKYLLDNFKLVYSYELAAYPAWHDVIIQEFSAYKNWKHELVLFRDIGFVDFNPKLPKALFDRISSLFREYAFDVVVVDPKHHMRGDLVNFVLHAFHPKYVIIHDINFAFTADRYDHITLPATYESVSSSVGEGTRIYYKRQITKSALSGLGKFLMDSNAAGYAGGKEKKWIKEPDGSTTIPFAKGKWKSADNFFGGEPYGGRTIVSHNGKPYWIMVYYGWAKEGIEANPVYNVLRSALKHMPQEHPFRGPKEYKEGNFVYTNVWNGGIERFSGEERIVEGQKLLYKANYMGGLVDQRRGL